MDRLNNNLVECEEVVEIVEEEEEEEEEEEVEEVVFNKIDLNNYHSHPLSVSYLTAFVKSLLDPDTLDYKIESLFLIKNNYRKNQFKFVFYEFY